MKTDELIGLLAASAEPVKPGAVGSKLSLAWLSGLLICAVIMAINLGVNPELVTAMHLSMFWIKLAYVVSLCVILWWVVQRLAQPGLTATRQFFYLMLPLLAMWLLALVQLNSATPIQAQALIWGGTWQACPLLIAELSVPIFISMMLAMKQLAPTQLRLAGAAAGLLSGASAALVYCLHCPEMGAPFLGIWYLLGMLIPAGFGALLGPKVLRW